MATQLIVGVLPLSNRFVPLALTVLAPFMVNSIAFHTFLEPTGRPMALIVVAIWDASICDNRSRGRLVAV